MKPPVQPERHSFEGRRITLRSASPFDEVVARLEAAFPRIESRETLALVAAGDGPGLRAFFESKAPGGSFCVFVSMDQGAAMSLLGTPLKSRFYLVGNALLAQRMFALEPAVGLCAPVRIVVSQAPGGETHVDYDEPTSMFGQFPMLATSPVPPLLDEKLLVALTAIAA